MRAFATHRTRSLLLVVLLATPLALTGTRANAQVSPLWDHYKVYFTPPFPAYPSGHATFTTFTTFARPRRSALAPRDEPLYAQVSPGNASSLRAVLAAGYRAIGSEVLFGSEYA